MSEQFKNRLRELRHERDMGQREVEELLNLRPGAVTQYERGLREPGFAMLVKMADLFDASLDYLMGVPDAPRESPALAGARRRLQAAVRQAGSDPRLLRPGRRLAAILALAEQAAPEVFGSARLGRQLSIPTASLRLAQEGRGDLSEGIAVKLATYLGFEPDWLVRRAAHTLSVRSADSHEESAI